MVDLCVIMDVASRKIAGWSLKKPMKADLVADALAMAIIHRRPPRVSFSIPTGARSIAAVRSAAGLSTTGLSRA